MPGACTWRLTTRPSASLPAVPPPLAAALGRELRKALEKTAESKREKALAA